MTELHSGADILPRLKSWGSPATDGGQPTSGGSQVPSIRSPGGTCVQGRASTAPGGDSGLGSLRTGAYLHLGIPSRSGAGYRVEVCDGAPRACRIHPTTKVVGFLLEPCNQWRHPCDVCGNPEVEKLRMHSAVSRNNHKYFISEDRVGDREIGGGDE